MIYRSETDPLQDFSCMQLAMSCCFCFTREESSQKVNMVVTLGKRSLDAHAQ